MHDSHSIGVMPIWMMAAGAIVLIVVFVGGAGMARLTGIQSDEQRSVRPRGHSGYGKLLAIFAVVGVIVFGAVFKYRQAESVAHLNEAERQRQEASEAKDRALEQRVIEEKKRTEAVAEADEESTGDEAPAPESLPQWTQEPLTVVSTGRVDEVLLVAQSELWGTSEEAREEATVRAIAQLQDRVASDWPELDSWSIPADSFERLSLQGKPFTEIQMHDFGGVQEPMFRVYIQFKDSFQVRQTLLDQWRAEVDQWRAEVGSIRAREYALGMGGLGIGLAVISGLLRGLLAFSNRRRKTAVA